MFMKYLLKQEVTEGCNKKKVSLNILSINYQTLSTKLYIRRHTEPIDVNKKIP